MMSFTNTHSLVIAGSQLAVHSLILGLVKKELATRKTMASGERVLHRISVEGAQQVLIEDLGAQIAKSATDNSI